MKLLLDTHIWLWLFREPKRLGRRTLQILKDPSNELWLSPISTWEILTLHHRGRIKFHLDMAEWILRATAGMQEAAFTHEIAMAARQLPLHEDPADSMIAATALVLDLTLVTADEHLLDLANIKTLANR
ncbi:MAG: type II toxin-antitoxin system VapC family toxin [Candidatus Acidiferrum sp.]